MHTRAFETKHSSETTKLYFPHDDLFGQACQKSPYFVPRNGGYPFYFRFKERIIELAEYFRNEQRGNAGGFASGVEERLLDTEAVFQENIDIDDVFGQAAIYKGGYFIGKNVLFRIDHPKDRMVNERADMGRHVVDHFELQAFAADKQPDEIVASQGNVQIVISSAEPGDLPLDDAGEIRMVVHEVIEIIGITVLEVSSRQGRAAGEIKRGVLEKRNDFVLQGIQDLIVVFGRQIPSLSVSSRCASAFSPLPKPSRFQRERIFSRYRTS